MLRTIALLSILSAGCTNDAQIQAPPDDPADSLRGTCGEAPDPEPAWAVIPGTYPGQSDRVCLLTSQYVARDKYLQDVADYARCAGDYACRQLGGEASPNGCAR